jgi:hypothetical protein
MDNKARTHIKLDRKREGSQRRSSSVDSRPMATKPSNTTDRGSFSHRRQTIDSHLQKRVDNENCDSTHVSPTNVMDLDALSCAVSCATSSFAKSPLRKNKPTMRRHNRFRGSDILQSLENDRIPRSPLPTRQGSSRRVQRHRSYSGPESTSKLDLLGPPISITSVNTVSENDIKEPHPSKAERSEVKPGVRPALTRQVADLDDPAVISVAKRMPCKTDSIIVRSLRRSFQTRPKRSGSIDRDKNHNSTTVAKSMISFIEGGLPPTSSSKQRAAKGSEKSRRPPKSLPPLHPLSSEEAKRRPRSRRSGSGLSPFQLDQSCKDNIRHLSRNSGSSASPFGLDQSCNDDFPPCSFHGPCEEDSHAIFEFRRIPTTTIDGIVHLSLPDEVEGPRRQRRTRSVDSKSRQRSSLGRKITRSKSSSRSHSIGAENISLSGVPPRPKKSSTEKQSHTEGARQRSRSRGAKEDSPMTSSSSGADHGRTASNQKKRSGPSSSGYSIEAGKDDEVKTNRSSVKGVSPREDRPEGFSSRQRSGSIDNSLIQKRPSSNENLESQCIRTRSGSIDQSPWKAAKAAARTTQKSRTSSDSNDEEPNIAILQHPEPGKPSQESSRGESDVKCLRDCDPGIVPLPLSALHRLGDGDSAVALEINRTGKIVLDQTINNQEASAMSPVPAKKNISSHSNKSPKVGVLRKHTEDSLTLPIVGAFVKASKKSKSHQTFTRHGVALDQDDRSLSTTVSSISGALRTMRSREKLRRCDSFNGCSVLADLEERSNDEDAVVSFNRHLCVSSSKMNTTNTFLSHSINVEDRSVSTTMARASGGSTKQGQLGGIRRHNSLNGAEDVAMVDFFLNRSDESTHNQRPMSTYESSLGKVERSNGPGLGSSGSSFGNGTKPNRNKSLQISSVQLVSVNPEERSVSTSISTPTCKKMGCQKSKGSVALDLDSLDFLPGVDSGTGCHSRTVVDFGKSSADGMHVSSAVVGSNKKNDLRRSSSFNGSDAVAILNKSGSDVSCFTTSVLYAPKKKCAQPARRRSFNGPSVAADSDDDGFSGVFVPASRVHF